MEENTTDGIINFFILHGILPCVATEYVNEIDPYFYDSFYFYWQFVDKMYNNTKTIAGRHLLSFDNKYEIEESKNVICFSCLRIYCSKEIKDYRIFMDSAEVERYTALCIHCNNDTIISDVCQAM